MAIILVNAGIGILQEINAKRLVDKLSILTKPTLHVMRDGKPQIVDIQDIVLDDLLILESGDQVCNDAIVVTGSIEANESLLTGESDPVYKQRDASLLSGSSIIAGKCYARVVKVGKENYATALMHRIKWPRNKNQNC